MIFAILLLLYSPLVRGGSGDLYGADDDTPTEIKCKDGEYLEGIRILETSSQVNWINGWCTNEENWEEGAGKNSGSLLSSWFPSSMGFCGLSVAWYNDKFRYMCFRGSNDVARCYGDSDYASDLEDVISCTEDAPGDYRPRLTGMDIYFSGNNAFHGAKFYFDQSWECSKVLYIDHETDSQSELVGYYEHQGYYRGSAFYKHIDDTLDYCLYYKSKSWRISGCAIYGEEVYIQIDQAEAYRICPEDFINNEDYDENWYWYESSSGTHISNLYIVPFDAVPLSWGNSVGFWSEVTSVSNAVLTYSATQSFTSSSTSSHTFTEEETNEFTSTFASSLTVGYELGISADFQGLGVSEQYSFASTLESSASQTVVSATSSAISNSISDSSTQEITCSISSGQSLDSARLWLWTLYRAAENYADTGAYKSTCEFVLQTGRQCAAMIPPNCPPGFCADDGCMTCLDRDGVEPLRAVALMYDDYTGCFNELGIDVRCALSKRDYSCCTKNNPCGEWEGDCDVDEQCEGDLVCYQTNTIDYCLKADDPLVLAARRNLNQKPGLTRRLLSDVSEQDEEDYTTSVYLPVHTGCAQFFDEGHCTAGPLYEYCVWDSDSDTCLAQDGVTVPDVDATYVYYAPEERNYCGDDCQDVQSSHGTKLL